MKARYTSQVWYNISRMLTALQLVIHDTYSYTCLQYLLKQAEKKRSSAALSPPPAYSSMDWLAHSLYLSYTYLLRYS